MDSRTSLLESRSSWNTTACIEENALQLCAILKLLSQVVGIHNTERQQTTLVKCKSTISMAREVGYGNAVPVPTYCQFKFFYRPAREFDDAFLAESFCDNVDLVLNAQFCVDSLVRHQQQLSVFLPLHRGEERGVERGARQSREPLRR
eukprot:3527572-Pleurochrysis_carterae.AAC.1